MILTIMHLYIFILFGLQAVHSNDVILPWNLFQPLLLWGLFFRSNLSLQRSFFTKPFNWIVVSLFCVLPWLNIAGRWDHYLSFSLYCGGLSHLDICVEKKPAEPPPGPFKAAAGGRKTVCAYTINTYQWAMETMHSTPYPEERVYTAIARQTKKKYPGLSFRFYIYRSGFKKEIQELFP